MSRMTCDSVLHTQYGQSYDLTTFILNLTIVEQFIFRYFQVG